MNTDKLEHIAIEARRLHRDLIRIKSEVELTDETRQLHDVLRSAESGADLLTFWTKSAMEKMKNVTENSINK